MFSLVLLLTIYPNHHVFHNQSVVKGGRHQSLFATADSGMYSVEDEIGMHSSSVTIDGDPSYSISETSCSDRVA